ncbi:hypothetical protein Bbelb_016060 [Branchiostoma belcheri]|nr:hypothetical protein Bbelb_016060 [Branchiostoma belcheri]
MLLAVMMPLRPLTNLPTSTSRPRLAEAPVTHSEPSPEHQLTKNLPPSTSRPNTSRPRLAEAPVTHSEPSPSTSRPGLTRFRPRLPFFKKMSTSQPPWRYQLIRLTGLDLLADSVGASDCTLAAVGSIPARARGFICFYAPNPYTGSHTGNQTRALAVRAPNPDH